MRTRKLLTAATFAAVAVLAVVLQVPAQARTKDPSRPGVDEPVRTILDENRILALRRSDSDPFAKQIRSLYLLNQTKNQRLLDRNSVEVAVIDERQKAYAVWEKGAPLVELTQVKTTVQTSSGSEDAALELGFRTEASTSPGLQTPVAAAGAGMTAATVDGGRLVAFHCQELSVDGNAMSACGEMFKPDNDRDSRRDHYVVNRWGTATGKETDHMLDYVPVKIELTSSPAAAYARRTSGLGGYFPHDSTQLCNEGTTADVTLGTLALSIGLTNCAEKKPLVSTSAKSMGILYDDGFLFGGPRVKGAEFEADFFTTQGATSRPVLDSSNKVRFCRLKWVGCPNQSKHDQL